MVQAARLILAEAPSQEGPLYPLLQKLAIGLDFFDSSWKLSTGLSMERLWNAYRPQTPPTLQQLSASLKLEELADRFDALLWRSQVPVTQLSSIRKSIVRALATVRVQSVGNTELVNVSLLLRLEVPDLSPN